MNSHTGKPPHFNSSSLLETGKLCLVNDCNDYTYLNHSGCVKVNTIDDKKDFVVVEVSVSRLLCIVC